MNEKGGKLTGTVTDEMLQSSRSVLEGYRGRGTRGLQQYFSPVEAASLIREVFGDIAVLDMTAGDGSLIRSFRYRYGVEIDPDQARSGAYNAIVADIQKIFPLMKRMELRFDGVAINPPFGLIWKDAIYGELNSTLMTYLYALHLLAYYGQGAMIAGADRFTREILERPEGSKVYAAIDVPDMFDNADIPTVVAFFTDKDCGELRRWSCRRAELYDQRWEVKAARASAKPFVADSFDRPDNLTADWKTLADEYKRRYGDDPAGRITYNIGCKGDQIVVSLTPYQTIALNRSGELRFVQRLERQAISYFVLNRREWRALEEMEAVGDLVLASDLKDKVNKMLAQAEVQLSPLYPVKPTQRLGFLQEEAKLPCIRSDPEYGYVAGEKYDLSVNTTINSVTYSEQRLTKDGEVYEVDKLKEWKFLEIKVGEHTFNEESKSIQYLLDHFDMPDPGDVATNHPERLAQMQVLLERVREVYGDGTWSYRQFQIDDIARLLTKGGGLLAWEQGLGKTMGAMAFALACIELGAWDTALFIVPQDLIPQWRREAKRFFSRDLKLISNAGEANAAKREIKAGGTGWWITYYEAISRNGRKFELRDPVAWKAPHPKAGREYYDYEASVWREHPATVTRTSDEYCPKCQEEARLGQWFPKRGICERCGYSHVRIKAKAAYHHLTTTFKQGTVIIDEGTKIKSNDSLMSLSVRGIRARHKLLLTGTPIKNYIPDAFWLLWWALGNRSVRFPFNYQGGWTKFRDEFAVVEYTLDSSGSKRSSKALPEVCNLSVLWRMLCSSIIRRRKEETGEPLVEKTVLPVTCPCGEEQRKMYRRWLKGFARYFIATHPEAKISEYPALVERSAAILGQLWKLEFASVLPEAEPSGYYDRSPNWTPANLKALELAKEHAENGDKVLVGSTLMAYGKWAAEQLTDVGVKAVHIVEPVGADGQLKTKAPKKRAAVVHKFQTDGASVLCASIYSMKLGHNLDKANVLILHGLPWDFSSYDQFIARVHRLTSEKPVKVYVVMTEATIDERKWDLLNKKGAASQLALDGALYEENRQRIDLQQILDEMINRGYNVTDTVPEVEILAQWRGDVIQPPPVREPEWSVPVIEKPEQLSLF